MLVPEGDRFERENRFARFVHWLDLVLKTLRRENRAELTVGTYNYPYASRSRGSANAGDKRGVVCSPRTDADSIGLAKNPSVTDSDVVTVVGEVKTGVRA